jgi:hypothetical protein
MNNQLVEMYFFVCGDAAEVKVDKFQTLENSFVWEKLADG